MKKLALLILTSWTLSACTTMLETNTLESVNQIALVSVYISKDISPANSTSVANTDKHYRLDRHQSDAQQLVLTDLMASAEQTLQALNIWKIIPSSQWIAQSPLSATPPKLMPDDSTWVVKDGLTFLPTLNGRGHYNPFEKKYIQTLCEQLGVDAIGILQVELGYTGTGIFGKISDSNQITPQAEARFMLVTKKGEVAMDSKQYPSLFVGKKLILPVNLGSKLGTFRLAAPEGRYTQNYLSIAQKSTEYVLGKISRELTRLGPRAFDNLPSQTPLETASITARHNEQPAFLTPATAPTNTTPTYVPKDAEAMTKEAMTTAKILVPTTPVPATPVGVNEISMNTEAPQVQEQAHETQPELELDTPVEAKVEKSSSPMLHLEMATSAPPIMNLELPTEVDDIEIDIELDEEEPVVKRQRVEGSDPWGLGRYRRNISQE